MGSTAGNVDSLRGGAFNGTAVGTTVGTVYGGTENPENGSLKVKTDGLLVGVDVRADAALGISHETTAG